MQFAKIGISVLQHFRQLRNLTCHLNVFVTGFSIQIQRENFSSRSFVLEDVYCNYSSTIPSPWRRKLCSFSGKQFNYKQGHTSVKLTIENAATELQDKLVVLTLSDGRDYKFPWLWLRDNCQCAVCFNSSTHSRIIDWQTFDIDVSPMDISVGKDAMYVKWSDNHKSTFSISWLLERNFTSAAQNEWLTGTYQLPKVSWGSHEFPQILRRFRHYDVMNSDESLLEWLESLAVHGVAILEHTPRKLDQVRLLADRVAFIKRTLYGEEFQVKVQPGATNEAYLATRLQMHVDLPYYEHKPGLILLHCLVQAADKGGENQLTDGLRVAESLKASHPDVYKILATTPVEWMDIAKDETRSWLSMHRSPVICENSLGQFASINCSHQQRDSHFSVPLGLVNQWYEACAIFTECIHHPENTVFLKTEPGEMLTFDNHRLLHGRAGYEDKPGQERHLVGAYLDWDEVYSRIRVLHREKCSS